MPLEENYRRPSDATYYGRQYPAEVASASLISPLVYTPNRIPRPVDAMAKMAESLDTRNREIIQTTDTIDTLLSTANVNEKNRHVINKAKQGLYNDIENIAGSDNYLVADAKLARAKDKWLINNPALRIAQKDMVDQAQSEEYIRSLQGVDPRVKEAFIRLNDIKYKPIEYDTKGNPISEGFQPLMPTARVNPAQRIMNYIIDNPEVTSEFEWKIVDAKEPGTGIETDSGYKVLVNKNTNKTISDRDDIAAVVENALKYDKELESSLMTDYIVDELPQLEEMLLNEGYTPSEVSEYIRDDFEKQKKEIIDNLSESIIDASLTEQEKTQQYANIISGSNSGEGPEESEDEYIRWVASSTPITVRGSGGTDTRSETTWDTVVNTLSEFPEEIINNIGIPLARDIANSLVTAVNNEETDIIPEDLVVDLQRNIRNYEYLVENNPQQAAEFEEIAKAFYESDDSYKDKFDSFDDYLKSDDAANEVGSYSTLYDIKNQNINYYIPANTKAGRDKDFAGEQLNRLKEEILRTYEDRTIYNITEGEVVEDEDKMDVIEQQDKDLIVKGEIDNRTLLSSSTGEPSLYKGTLFKIGDEQFVISPMSSDMNSTEGILDQFRNTVYNLANDLPGATKHSDNWSAIGGSTKPVDINAKKIISGENAGRIKVTLSRGPQILSSVIIDDVNPIATQTGEYIDPLGQLFINYITNE